MKTTTSDKQEQARTLRLWVARYGRNVAAAITWRNSAQSGAIKDSIFCRRQMRFHARRAADFSRSIRTHALSSVTV